jgi:hypothetical protein
MSNNKKYLFFNKDGYPHNFQYTPSTESWNGKIIFDENSDQTFRTQSLHIFESVDPIEFVTNSDLIEMQYNNNSGLTIYSDSGYKNVSIDNILKVNDSNIFYSKYIYGKDFHKKFPVGTVIEFKNVSGTTLSSGDMDFTDDQYFTVLSVKKNAILIQTNTSNDIFNFNFISGYVSSINMISINDYNRNLSNENLFQNLYTNKKISIINSNYNDKIVSVMKSGITYSYINDILLTGNTNQFFQLDVEFFTERPKIIQGDVTLSETHTTEGSMNIGKYAYLLAPETTYTGSGEELIKKEIVFEDSLGNKLFNGYTFIIDSLITSEFIENKILTFKQYYNISQQYKHYSVMSNTNQWNTIQYLGKLNINQGDIISLIGISGSTQLMNNREFSVINATYNSTNNMSILFVSGYIIDEDNSTYSIIKKLQPNQIRNVKYTASGDVSSFDSLTIKDAYCYSTSTKLSFTQKYLSGTTSGTAHVNTINSFINKYKTILYQNGIDIYHTIKNNNDYLSVENLYGAKREYFYASGFTNAVKIEDDLSLTNNGLTKRYDIITREKLSGETTNRMSPNLYNTKVNTEIFLNLKNDNDRFGFKLTLNTNEYSINYFGDTLSTINGFIDMYGDVMFSNGFTINSGYNYSYSGYTLNITSDIDIWNVSVTVNILSTYKIIKNQRNKYIILSANEIRSNLINLFDINLATGMLLKITGSTYNTNNKEYNIISLTNKTIGLSYQGVFTTENNVYIKGTTREFIRKPRGDYYRDIYLRAYWEEPYDNNIDTSIFLYDITGNQLKPYNNISSLTYTGPTPLVDTQTNNVVFLNNISNSDLNKVNNSKYQQTVFEELTFKLEQLDSSSDFDWIPEPLEIFIGYNSADEGINTRTLKIETIEKFENDINYLSLTGYTNSGTSQSTNNFILNFDTINYIAPIDFNFLSYGFKKDQLIKLSFKDQSKKKQRIFENSNTYKILDVTRTKILIDTGYTYTYNGVETVYTYDSSGFTYFTTTGTTFFYKIEVQPKEILSCILYGQTEIEDIRFKVNLNNLGVQSEDDIYQIFYASDIQDDAIDYTIFNKKRKELLTEYREIYDYIGSYKALVNAINYFGYNNLFLYEYYRNIDQSSPLYSKLHKVLIPDIFDSTIAGWNEIDFISGKYQNQLIWKKTNLFNLAYDITDEEGNNTLIYSLDEVQYKLTKLKSWLRKNIIPVSVNLLDITGVADTTHTLYQDYDESNQTKKSIVERNSTVVNFNYTATLNFETDYLITVNFYILSGTTGTDIDYNEAPKSYSVKIKTFYLSGTTFDNPTNIMIPVQYFKVFKTDLKPFSFNLNKNLDPYIYIETTTYDNDGCGLGYVNNKLFYYDEPRNYWLVNNNFDLTKMKYYQTPNYISNSIQITSAQDVVALSTVVSSSVETIVNVNTLNNNYISKLAKN